MESCVLLVLLPMPTPTTAVVEGDAERLLFVFVVVKAEGDVVNPSTRRDAVRRRAKETPNFIFSQIFCTLYLTLIKLK